MSIRRWLPQSRENAQICIIQNSELDRTLFFKKYNSLSKVSFSDLLPGLPGNGSFQPAHWMCCCCCCCWRCSPSRKMIPPAAPTLAWRWRSPSCLPDPSSSTRAPLESRSRRPGRPPTDGCPSPVANPRSNCHRKRWRNFPQCRRHWLGVPPLSGRRLDGWRWAREIVAVQLASRRANHNLFWPSGIQIVMSVTSRLRQDLSRVIIWDSAGRIF